MWAPFIIKGEDQKGEEFLAVVHLVLRQMSTADPVICLLSEPFLSRKAVVWRRGQKKPVLLLAPKILKIWLKAGLNFGGRICSKLQLYNYKAFLSQDCSVFTVKSMRLTTSTPFRQLSLYTCLEISRSFFTDILAFCPSVGALACVYRFKLDPFRHLCYARKLSYPGAVQDKLP